MGVVIALIPSLAFWSLLYYLTDLFWLILLALAPAVIGWWLVWPADEKHDDNV